MDIATSSVEEGLDFACNLTCSLISMRSLSTPAEFLALLSAYVVHRYAGEFELALEELQEIGILLREIPWKNREQFSHQLTWVAGQMGLSLNEQ